jgi:hypothetical protein
MVSILALLGAAACDRSSEPAPSPHPTGPVRAALAPDGGVVRVVEQGFTTRTSRTGRPLVSYGFVLQNTSKAQAARDIVVLVTLTTASGASVTDYAISPKRNVGAILLPGQRIGVGWNSRVDTAGTTRVRLQVRSAIWTPAGALQRVNGRTLAVARLTADGVRTSPAPTTVSFTVHSEYPMTLDRVWAYVVYRDPAGNIVGGTNSRLSGRWITTAYPPGSSPGRLVDPNGPPARADLDRTEVYLSPAA